MAHVVGGHLRMAGMLMDEEPALALRHAMAAKRRAGRLLVVREAMAEAAYAAEDFRAALAEYQALRRMTDDENYLPVIADCQRALGKPNAAVELLGRADATRMNSEQQVEAVLVEAGARQDLHQESEAQRLLQAAISQRRGGHSGQARLRYAYAALLETLGDEEGARTWYKSALELDAVQPDAQRGLAALDGHVVEDDLDDGAGDFVVAEIDDDEPVDDEFDDDESDGDEPDDDELDSGEVDDSESRAGTESDSLDQTRGEAGLDGSAGEGRSGDE